MNKGDEQINKIIEWLGTGSINIFGWPFSGKDTQGRKLSKLLNATLIGGGDILRNSQLPDKVQKIMDSGELIPTQYYYNLVLPYFDKTEFNGKPLVLSSVGRWHGEEFTVMNAAAASKHPIKAVIYLDLNENTATSRARLSKLAKDRGGRVDDADEFLSVRFEEFKLKTLPVIDFYKSKGLLLEVDGRLSKDEVTQNIIEKLLAYGVKSADQQ